MFKRSTLFILSFLVASCASTNLKYPINKDAYAPASGFPYKVVIAPFEDKRPEEERDPNIGHERIGFYSSDKSFRGEVGTLVADSLAAHMNGTKLFAMVDVHQLSPGLENRPDQMENLKREGYDFAITGSITHAVGYKLTENAPITEFGLIGGIYDAATNKRRAGAHAEYAPVKVIDLNRQKVVLNETIEFQQEENHYYEEPHQYAERGIREVNNQFIRKLEAVLNSY